MLGDINQRPRRRGAADHPLPWQSAFYNETLSPAITYGLAREGHIGALDSIRRIGAIPRRSDAPVASVQDGLRHARSVINGRPRRRS